MDKKVPHGPELCSPVLPPQPDVLQASDGAVGVGRAGGAVPRTAEGADEVVDAEKPWRSETKQVEEDLSPPAQVCFSCSFTLRAAARRGGVQPEQKHHQRARGAADLHGYGTVAEE